MSRAVAAVALAAALALGVAAGCGGGDDEFSDAARDQLAPLVAEVRRSAQSFDPDGVATALRDVRQAVADLRERGEIGSQRAAEILAMAAQVEGRIDLVPTTTTTTTTTLPPPPPQAGDDDDDDNGGGPGRGRGRGGGRIG